MSRGGVNVFVDILPTIDYNLNCCLEIIFFDCFIHCLVIKPIEN